METLSLTQALADAEVSRQWLASKIGEYVATVWKWESVDPRYIGSIPSAVQIDNIGNALRLDHERQAKMVRWFAARARGEL